MPSHTDKAFERDLAETRNHLLVMGDRVRACIEQSVRAFSERDSGLAKQVLDSDREINRLELQIDELCRTILALRQPAASDLRLITTALKIVTDLERCGDLAVNIALRAQELNQAPPLQSYEQLTRLADLAQRQLQHALDAFVKADVALAQEVLAGDDALDALYRALFNELLSLMMEDSKFIRRATSLMFVGKHLERIGDHAMNIAEMVVYMVKGKDIRHPRSRQPDSKG